MHNARVSSCQRPRLSRGGWVHVLHRLESHHFVSSARGGEGGVEREEIPSGEREWRFRAVKERNFAVEAQISVTTAQGEVTRQPICSPMISPWAVVAEIGASTTPLHELSPQICSVYF
ncbi:hypothetical protein CRG98_025277 [Punica granatum]|uniref:Uncharacterized protein n=1 Tax=Punica granatum TaxID=22663 RepID=A0A2I0JDL6_PUNGR|nr:hypothetical protein CRG98_025277 [Punica granatum]